MATTMKLIAKQTLGSDTASVTFSGIPQTYDDLVVSISQRNSNATGGGGSVGIRMDINDLTTNRSWMRLACGGTTAYSDSGTTTLVGVSPAANATANTFGNMEIYFPNYAGSSNKSFSVSDVVENNSATSNQITLIAGLWSSTAAITKLSFNTTSGSLVTGSSFYLYGVNNA